tara:strand:+ start:2433 stop:2738 length:306 start_codon:yes stop_codon:yes gene_type:complete
MELTKEKLKEFIDDYQNNPITKKWVESVENRGKFQRELDKEFFELSKTTINQLLDLILFMNTIYGSVDKVTESIVIQQEKYLEIVDDFEKQLIKLKNGNKG